MNDPLLMSAPVNLMATPSATSLPVLAAGASPSNEQDGPPTAPSGPAPALVNPSVSPDAAVAAAMRAISGPILPGSSESASLQSSLANRLRANLADCGSPLFKLTWKHWPMLSGQPICALRASGHRISDNDSGGWPTPSVSDDNCSRYENPQRASAVFLNRVNSGSNLAHWAQGVAGWPTPQAHDTRPAGQGARERGGFQSSLPNTVLTGWGTPSTRDHKDTGDMSQSMTRQDGKLRNDTVPRQAYGAMLSGSPASTTRPGQLNPALARWLMSYPVAWCQAAIRATRAMPTRRRKGV